MTLSSAFLICHVWLTAQVAPTWEAMGYNMPLPPYHPGVYKALKTAEQDIRLVPNAARVIALVDSARGIPLAECLLEQFSKKRLYPRIDYPRPPYETEWFKRTDK
jgi:hypothetical protein